MVKETVLQRIIAFIFGHKYYANIVNLHGTDQMNLSGFIFGSPEEAEKHRKELTTNRSYMYIETVSFRSRENY